MTNTIKKTNLPPPVIDNLKHLGSRVAFARKIQQLRQDDLSSMAGISRSTLTEIEKGSPFVSIGSYMAILWALGIMNDILATDMSDEERRLVASDLPKRVRHG
ncbi:MAG: XRE family transcriptional regulator [Candidatus Gallionella acididurans]|uniref:XRE family transcriptional regulator n=1 Tax=Candidatus Gallionella acididurans TaxID=1796491 RepID=A0A139BU25_9PROT|nr:MAG: XRE family transcriptional regulator [Candidatus Gallionella acididurans]